MLCQITKWDNSHGVRLPKVILQQVLDTQEVEIVDKQDVIEIRKAKTPITLESIFQNYTGEKATAYDWGKQVGQEEW